MKEITLKTLSTIIFHLKKFNLVNNKSPKNDNIKDCSQTD